MNPLSVSKRPSGLIMAFRAFEGPWALLALAVAHDTLFGIQDGAFFKEEGGKSLLAVVEQRNTKF
jgi:hypothetical protein